MSKRIFPLQLEKNKLGKATLDVRFAEANEGLNGDTTPFIKEWLASSRVILADAMKTSAENIKLFEMRGADVMEEMMRDSGVHQAWQHYRWDLNGRIVYDLNAPIAKAFLETDLDRVIKEDLIPKAPTVYIAVPDDLDMKCWHVTTGDHDLDGFYVSYHPDDDHLYICTVGRAQQGRPAYDNALCTLAIDLQRDNIEEWVNEISHNDRLLSFMKPNVDRYRSWICLILNTLLYVNSHEPDVQRNRDFGIRGTKLRQASKLAPKVRERFLGKYRENIRYMHVGRSYREPSVPGVPSDRKLMARSRVNGHWKTVLCGTNRSERRVIWVAPYWRGPEDGPLLKTTTVVKVRD